MSSFGVQGAIVLAGRIVIRLSQFVAFFVLARFLTVEQFGWFGLVTTAISLAAVLGSLGLRQSFTFEIGQGRISDGQALGTSLVIWLPLTLVSGAVIVLAYGQKIDGLSLQQASAFIFLGVAAMILITLLQGVFLGKGMIWAFSLSEAMPRVALMLGALLLLLFADAGLEGALWVQVLAFLVPIPVTLVIALRSAGRIGTAFRQMGGLLRYGLVFALNLFVVTLSARVSMFILEAVSGPESAGQFFAASRLNDIVLEIAIAFGLVLFSNTARATDVPATIARNVKVAALMFWLFAIIAAAVALLAPFLLTVALGPGYEEAAPALQIMAIALAPAAANKMIYPTFAGTGNPFFGTPVLVGSLLINALISLLLIPYLGIVGGAIGLAVGQWMVFVGYAVMCRLKYKIAPLSLIVPDLSAIKFPKFLRGRRRGGPNDEGPVGEIL